MTEKHELLSQAEAAIDKQAKEALMNKLKDLVKKRKEAEKQVALVQLEIDKLLEEHSSGV